MSEDPNYDVANTWLWDRRTNKAYYPVRTDERTVRMVTVWHREEIEGATEEGALVPIEEIDLDRADTTFDLLESFRLPPEEELKAHAEGHEE